MNKLLKSTIREITPPIVLRGMRSLVRSLSSKEKGTRPNGIRPAQWYDSVYESSVEYRKHYTESVYYFLWTVLVDRMMYQGVDNVLDLGCGPGQFGSLLLEKGFRHYCGVDFSHSCIELAKQNCPSFDFVVANILESDVLEVRDYDCVLAMEFLEHVEEDVDVLSRIKAGVKFFGTVPSFPYISHVRHFSNIEEVEVRYSSLFSSFRVDTFLADPEGNRFYLFEGVKI